MPDCRKANIAEKMEHDMKVYEATADIDATPDAIWAVLTDGQRMPTWDSGVERFEGTIAPGAKLKVYVAANPGRAFPVKVTEFEPARRMVWTGGMPLGLFKGVRTYTLDAIGAGSTRFTMREVYSGPLLGVIGKSIPDLGPSFTQFAHGLKRETESRAGATP